MQKNSNYEEKGQGLRYEVSTESRELAQSHMGILPPRFQTDVMLNILVRTLYDGRFRQEFRANPQDLMNEVGLSIPSSVKVDVHDNAEDTLHIVLPGVPLQKAPRKAAKTGKLSLAEYEARKAGKTVITDEDLGSGPSVGWFNDDFIDSPADGNDPTARDVKGDGAGGDGIDRINQGDRDPTDKDLPENTGLD